MIEALVGMGFAVGLWLGGRLIAALDRWIERGDPGRWR